MSKVFCIGELLIDFIGKDINKGLKNGVVFEKKAGGAPANVAAAVCRLGGKSEFLGQVGNDSFGKFLMDMIRRENIGTTMTKMDGYTTLAFVAIDENGERDFEFHRGSDSEYSFENINTSNMDKKDIIHFGSATAFLEGELRETYFKLLEFGNKNGNFISFDPNFRDALITKDKINEFISFSKEFIKNADFIKVSDEEIRLITGKEDLYDCVNEIHSFGGKVVAVTLGREGTLISDGENIEIVPSIKIKQIDSTGAGDAFVGAALKKISERNIKKDISFKEFKDIIAYGNRVGAITCTNYGAIDSIPTENDLLDL